MRALRKAGAYMKGDERILGEGDFVEKMLAQAEGSRKNNLAELALRFGSDLADPKEQNHGNS